MSWFDTPDSWWDKDKTGETNNSYKLETWDLNRDNVPEEYHWPYRLRASFTIRVQGEPYDTVSLIFHVRDDSYDPYYDITWEKNLLDDEILECYSRSGDFHEFICVDVEFPITYHEDLVFPVDYSLYPSYKYRLRIMASAIAYGYSPDYHMTEAKIHNIQFFSGSFWHKFVNTYEV